ncbi:hypothetical protein [Streptomyces sp. NPDC002209]|uniref:hypothetical protein n=1 Tax=Streptomyces sp. NPDC002209 TaxID=3364638 RepID=UPI0036CDFB78
MRATFRTAAVAAGAVTALALPAAPAFAADTPAAPAAPSPQAEPVTREALRTAHLERGWSGRVYEPARYEGAAKPGPEPGKVTPKGAVRAGAEAVGTSGDGAALIAGGAGLAAAGAAGLGFTMRRRRRSEG